MLDLSCSQSGLVPKNINIAMSFLRKVLQPGDTVFVGAFAGSVKLVQDSTSSLTEVADAISHVRERYKKAATVGQESRNDSPIRDAIYLLTPRQAQAGPRPP